MTGREARRYAMLVRVRDFGAAHRDRFPDSSVGAEAFAAIAAAVSRLEAHHRVRISGSRPATAKRLARQALLARLHIISRTARAIAIDRPEFDDRFRLPERRPRDQVLLVAGQVFLETAEACAADFVAYGLPVGFVEELKQLVDGFEQAMRECDEGRGKRAASRSGMERGFSSGLTAVRKLDVIVNNQFAGDEDTLAGWTRHRRIDTRPL
jgi:hypothetical protein